MLLDNLLNIIFIQALNDRTYYHMVYRRVRQSRIKLHEDSSNASDDQNSPYNFIKIDPFLDLCLALVYMLYLTDQ